MQVQRTPSSRCSSLSYVPSIALGSLKLATFIAGAVLYANKDQTGDCYDPRLRDAVSCYGEDCQRKISWVCANALNQMHFTVVVGGMLLLTSAIPMGLYSSLDAFMRRRGIKKLETGASPDVDRTARCGRFLSRYDSAPPLRKKLEQEELVPAIISAVTLGIFALIQFSPLTPDGAKVSDEMEVFDFYTKQSPQCVTTPLRDLAWEKILEATYAKEKVNIIGVSTAAFLGLLSFSLLLSAYYKKRHYEVMQEMEHAPARPVAISTERKRTEASENQSGAEPLSASSIQIHIENDDTKRSGPIEASESQPGARPQPSVQLHVEKDDTKRSAAPKDQTMAKIELTSPTHSSTTRDNDNKTIRNAHRNSKATHPAATSRGDLRIRIDNEDGTIQYI